MPDDKPIPEGSIETDKPTITKGKLGISWKNPTSTKVRIICETIIGSNIGLTALVAGSDLFTGFQSKAIIFILSGVSIIAGAFMKSTGVKPAQD